MPKMLDTDTCIYAINGRYQSVTEELAKYGSEEVLVSSITSSELWYGIRKSQRTVQNVTALEAFLLLVTIVDYGADAAHLYGDVRSRLEQQGTPIGSRDTFIAAHALSLGVPLVTNNTREFARIPNLALENWVVI